MCSSDLAGYKVGSEGRKRRERWQRDAGAGRERWERRERAEQEAGDSFVLRERREHHRKHGINQQCFSMSFFLFNVRRGSVCSEVIETKSPAQLEQRVIPASI